MRRFLYFICVFPFLLGCTSKSDRVSFDTEEVTGLQVRNAHSMAYHTKDSLVYLFGGASHREVRSDLWVLADTTWLEIETDKGPEARTFAPLIYDHENNRLVLFGGSKVLFGKSPDPQNLLNDTWEFKNDQWKKLNTNHAPLPRAEAMMVYDENRNTIVLFGGYHIQDGDYLKLKDTWEFYDNDWHLISSSGPSARHGVSMAYDPKNKSVLLFGGSTVDKQYGASSGETWQWNGNQWNKIAIQQPSGTFNAPMVYDKTQEVFIRFGGWNGETRINDTWSFQNNEWNVMVTRNSPSSRNHTAMVYDENNQSIVLFGGHDGQQVFGDTWMFSNGEWHMISGSNPVRRVKNGH